MPDACTPRNLFSIKLQRSLYGLKQSGRMWYQRLSEYLIKERYKNDPIFPCVFIKKSETGFAIVAVYVDDINLIGTPKELAKTAEYLKKEFEVKDLGKTKLCHGLQLEHKANGIIVHQSSYIERLLKRFNMDKAHPLSTPMVVRSLYPQKDQFRPRESDEEILGHEVPYLNAIGALMLLIEPKHMYEFITPVPKDYCLIPGNGAIKLVDRTKTYTQVYDVITKGLLSNPRQRRHKTC